MVFKNFTPHNIVLNDGREFASEGLARVSSEHTAFSEDGVCEVVFGEVSGLPEPVEGTMLIVSALVAQAAKRGDVVSPATGHPQTVRNEKGHIVSVPGFVRAV